MTVPEELQGSWPSSIGMDAAKDEVNVIPPQTDIFTWRDVNYDIEIKGEPRRLLDQVSGFVRPGTLTALMGTSGAGKTTLLDVSYRMIWINGRLANPALRFWHNARAWA